MIVNDFVQNFRSAFGNAELPIAIWYSDKPCGVLEKSRGCFIKDLKPARNGEIISLNKETITCPGGKVYTGFTEMPPFIPKFVSEKERYKKSPEMVTDWITQLEMPIQADLFINFVSVDKIDSFDGIEGLVFFATPDVLTGLCSWAHYDTNNQDSICVPFGSGCSLTIAQMVVENRNSGYRTFLGMFDPSAREHVAPNILSFAIPLSRFKQMYFTMNESCLSGVHAWKKVKSRIEEDLND